MKNEALQKLLGKRKLDVGKLADQLLVGRSHLTQVFLGTRKGTRTWQKLDKAVEQGVLTREEFDCAKAYADEKLAERQKAGKANGEFAGVAKASAAA